MYRPRLSYLVCATPRSGSSLLCEALKNTGLAGRPEEYFWWGDEIYWRDRWGVSGFGPYLAQELIEGSTPNGVFGAKVMWGYLDDMVGELRSLPGSEGRSVPQLLAGAFPDLRYVWITRRDTVRQAVSWARAVRTGVWEESGGGAASPASEPPFDFDAVDHLVGEIERHNAAWQAHFREAGAEPFKVVYEELAERYEETALSVLAWLGITAPPDLRFGDRRLRRQANTASEEWVERYRERKVRASRREPQ